MKKEKIYLVKREVIAKNIEEAMHKDGKIYSIEESIEEPELEKNEEETGFVKNRKKR